MTETLPDDIAGFGRDNPDVRLLLEERWSTEIVRGINGAEADVGIIVEGANTDGLETIVYGTDRLAVVMPADHPLARRPQMQFVDVLDDDLIALESSSAMMRLLTEQAVIAERTLHLRGTAGNPISRSLTRSPGSRSSFRNSIGFLSMPQNVY